jgi:predicted O-methyltransferase YrrM
MFANQTIAEAVAACEAFIADKDDAWSIDRPSAEFLHQMVLARSARVILEIGASYGHSGLFLAAAATRTDGRLFTVERDPRKVAIARGFFQRAGLSDRVTILHGEAPAILSQAPASIDLLFIDATKSQQDMYLDALWPRLARRAAIITDNVSTHPAEMAGFLNHLRTDPRLASALVPFGHGMEFSVRVD